MMEQLSGNNINYQVNDASFTGLRKTVQQFTYTVYQHDYIYRYLLI